MDGTAAGCDSQGIAANHGYYRVRVGLLWQNDRRSSALGGSSGLRDGEDFKGGAKRIPLRPSWFYSLLLATSNF